MTDTLRTVTLMNCAKCGQDVYFFEGETLPDDRLCDECVEVVEPP